MTSYELRKGESEWITLLRDGKVLGVARTAEELADLLEEYNLKLTPT